MAETFLQIMDGNGALFFATIRWIPCPPQFLAFAIAGHGSVTYIPPP